MPDIIPNILPEVRKLLDHRELTQLKRLLSAMEPADIAEMLEEFEPSTRVLFFRLLPKDLAIEVFEMLEGQERETLLSHFTDREVAEILGDMSDDDRTELLDELPAKTVKKLLESLPTEERTLANRLMNYAEESAGRVMTPEYIDLKQDMTVDQAIDRIRMHARGKETIYTAFVVDTKRQLVGVVELEDLILARGSTSVRAVMDSDPVWVTTRTDREEVARELSKYDFQALPVVDSEHRLVGIVTFDDVLDIMEEEATEDFERMAGIEPTDVSYINTGFFTMARKRFMWLFICILTETITSSVLKAYSITLQSAVALTYFIPLLIGTGGNAGTQSATLMIRGMTLGEIQRKNIVKVFFREIGTGLFLGVALAAFALGRAYMLDTGAAVGLTVALGVVGVVLLGNLAGVLLPVIARMLKIDPAIMSGPFITTVVDVLGLLVYFEIARRILMHWG
ncbi:MAG: magnesium transporter [Synergistales bacterium]|nr:magnesium transporter [Synergistales bacterium]